MFVEEDEGNANITIVPSAPSPESTDNNNSFYASTPMSKTSSVTSNGFSDALNVTNGSYILSPMDNDLASPMASRAKNESYMNNRNINGNSNGNGINNNANIANINANTTTIVAEIEGEVKKRVPRCDKIYYIAKEILCTEITYQKDLEVINTCFRREFEQEGFEECSILLGLVAPLAHAHALLVSDLEQRMSNWDVQGGVKNNTGKIADVLLVHLPPLLTVYEEYLDGHLLVLERLDQASKQNSRFEHLYREFETQKVCYLPLSAFVLKPLHRLLHYQSLLQRLLKNYTPNHPDINDCMTVNDSLKDLIQPVLDTLAISENIATLCELQRDVCGYDSIVQNGRKFVRHGCLLKHSSKKGYQQRMFFLFSDILLYTSRSAATQFKVHGHMPLRGVLIEEPDGELANYGLIIYGGNRALTVAANSQEEKERWKADLHQAIKQARDKTDAKVTYLSLKSSSSSDEIIEQCGNEPPKAPLQRNNTTVHVCWHRNTSISMKDQLIAVENQLSGYLLRKFKSSNGWQKLWVVFTSFCLFFYKRSTDDFPLASLPLLCYTVGAPTVEDAISKDFVFKLQYKNHVYFFRAESEYTYQRWLEVISSATQQGTIKRRHIDNIANQNSIETSPEK